MRKRIALLLTLILALAVLFGCGRATSGHSLNGARLADYAIVYSASDTRYAATAATYIRDRILEKTGLELPIQTDDQVTASYEIVVGDTQREISSRLNVETGADSFAIMADTTQIGLEGDYFLIAAAAYYFVETYIGQTDAQLPGEATVCHPITQTPTNFIFLIGDGMGVNHTKLFDQPPMTMSRADGYSDGEDLFYGYLLPAQGFARTNSLSGVTDSAAAGTALASGYKTDNGSVGLDANEQPVQSLTELANSLGKATAVMSTEAKTGATPAAFSAHVTSRDEKTDILESQSVIQQAGTIINCNYDVYQVELLKRRIDAEVKKTLEQLEQDPDGFFLMYEEAYIDKHSHDNAMNETFLAVVRFNRVIGHMMEYAYYHPDTFVLITADHETGKLLPAEAGAMAFNYDDHTDADVPVFAHGQGSALFDGRTVENVQIPKTIAKLWGVDEFGDPGLDPALSE